MPELDPLLLSRIQFAFTISFHILFPSFTIGLAAWLVVLEALWLRTGKDIYLRIAQHWTKIFAISFGMGVVSGVVLSYEFGTNWSELSRRGGNVIGPLMSYEVLTAFFLEAGFPRHHAVRLEPRAEARALLRFLHGRARHADFGFLDPVRQ
jgi:cytochrome d ubiquinol oxidase subunit I